MRVLITGVGGFAGSFLAEHLLAEGYDVWGIVRNNAGHAEPLREQIQLRTADVTDRGRITTVLDECRPERIYHLAAQAFVPASWDDPWTTLEINIRGQLNVLLALRTLELSARVLVVGSNEEYGAIRQDALPITETTEFRPSSPYAVSKIAQDMLGFQYWKSHNLHTVRVRAFNHIGPRQSPQFVAASFAQQIAEIEAGLRPPRLKVGNLTAKRDFTDVRDIVSAYHLVLERGEPGDVYNVGSGEAHSIQELLDILLAHSSADVTIEQEPARMRPADVPITYADTTKIKSDTGWQRSISFEESLESILVYWREVVSRPTYSMEDS